MLMDNKLPTLPHKPLLRVMKIAKKQKSKNLSMTIISPLLKLGVNSKKLWKIRRGLTFPKRKLMNLKVAFLHANDEKNGYNLDPAISLLQRKNKTKKRLTKNVRRKAKEKVFVRKR